MPVWAIAAVNQRPQVTLTDWALFEVPLNGADEVWTRHLVGYASEDRQGQVSSPLQVFDPASRKAVTRSGRVYLVRGRPGLNADADYVWGRWKSHAGVLEERDVTGEIMEDMGPEKETSRSTRAKRP
jgi:hypothetical protein